MTRIGVTKGDISTQLQNCESGLNEMVQADFKYYEPVHLSPTTKCATDPWQLPTFVPPDDDGEMDNDSELGDSTRCMENWETCLYGLVDEEGIMKRLQRNENLEQFVGPVYVFRMFNNFVNGACAFQPLSQSELKDILERGL